MFPVIFFDKKHLQQNLPIFSEKALDKAVQVKYITKNWYYLVSNQPGRKNHAHFISEN